MFEILITNKDDSFTVIRTSQPVVFTNNCLGYKPDNQRQTVYLQLDTVKSVAISDKIR